MHRIGGQCRCGKLRFEAEFSQPLSAYRPRSCDCDYCRARNLAYVSDPRGRLQIQASGFQTERQGSGTAEFLVCPDCDVLVAVMYRDSAALYAAVNVNATDNPAAFGESSSVSPKLLSTAEKIKRWKENWFPATAL